MKISAKNKDRVLAPEGVHAARCVRIIDLGTQENKKYGNKARKVQLSFELVDETHIWDEDRGEEPFVLHRKYTASLGKKASLARDIQAWLGTKLEKNAEFDIADLLDKPCQVQVLHNESEEGEKYANIQSIMAPPKNVKVKKAATELQLLSLEADEFDQDIFDSLPEFLQEQIEESPEYEALQEEAPKPTAKKAAAPVKKPVKGKK